MNPALLHKEVQDFLSKHYDQDISRISLQGSPFKDVSTQELGVQLMGKKKAEKKLPSWFNTQGVLYPPSLNLEQTSSEVTAAYKASFIKGATLIDLTGGFGVDSHYFAKNVSQVIHCELNPALSELVLHNSRQLGTDNIHTHKGDGLDYLKESSSPVDWIYIDPSRRDDSGGRVFRLSDCLPDVPAHLDLLLQKAPKVLMKTSPLLDLQSGVRSLGNNVKEIHIVAVENEVKELLWFLEKEPTEAIEIRTINFKKNQVQELYASQFQRRGAVKFGEPLTYLYEPNAAIMKSGLFDALGTDFGLVKLHPNSHLYTSDHLKDFPGRRFRVEQCLPYSRKKLKQRLKLEKANISTRNFPESVASLRKQFKLKDGGDDYLFFTTTGKEERIVLVCRKE